MKKHNSKFKILFISIVFLMALVSFTIFEIQKNGGIKQTLYQTIANNLINDSEVDYQESLNSIGNIVQAVQNANTSSNKIADDTQNVSNKESTDSNTYINSDSASVIEVESNSITEGNSKIAEILSDDNTLHSIIYDENELQIEEIPDVTIKGQSIINIEPEQEEISIGLTANEKATIQVGNASQTGTLNITKNVKVMFNDMNIDITIKAENGDTAVYRVIIHKNTYLTGKVITEGNYSDINIKLLDANNEIVKEFISEDGNVYTPVDTENTYKIEIKKDGYLKHTFTNFKAAYGSKNYFGEVNLLSGEVTGNDEYINLKDLSNTNFRAQRNIVPTGENKKYDFNDDGKIDNTDMIKLTNNYNKKAIEVEFEIYDATPVIEEINTSIELENIQLSAIVKDESLDKVVFHINGQNIEGEINGEDVTAIYNYQLSFNEEIVMTVEAIDTTDKKTISEEIKIVGNLIRNIDDLLTFANCVNNKNNYEGQKVELVADLDLDEINYKSIGESQTKTFNGEFEGNGHVISNINSEGLFGFTKDAKIQNLGITGTINSIKNYSGAIVELAKSTIINNCFSLVNISGKNNVGGIAGYATGSTITNCYTTGTITGEAKVGGILGSALGGTDIINCYSISKITGDLGFGKVLGYTLAGNSTVSNCHYSLEENEEILGIGTITLNSEDYQTFEIEDMIDLAETLGQEFKPDYYRQINNGYPILKWQKRISPFIPALIIDTDGGEYEGETLIEQEIGTTYNLLEPIKDGLIFDGWNIKYGDGIINENTFTFGEEDTLIVAQWRVDAYTITYNLDGGKVKGKNPTEYTEESENITLINPTKAGYIFLGWSGTGLEDLTENVTILSGSKGNREYTANWEEAKITIADRVENNEIQLGDVVKYKANNNGIYSYSNVTSDNYMRWKVLNIKEDEKTVELVSVVPLSNYVSFTNSTAYINAEDTLNNYAAIFGHGKGAVSARSININDIEKYSSYDKSTFSTGSPNYNKVGSTKTYTGGYYLPQILDDDGNVIGYGTEIDDTPNVQRKLIHTAYKYTSNGNFLNETIKKLLFEDESGNAIQYWLASRAVNLDYNGYVIFKVANKYFNYSSNIFTTSDLRTPNGDSSYVRPVVLMDSTAKIEKNSAGEWELVLISEEEDEDEIQIGDIVNYNAGSSDKVYSYTTNSAVTGYSNTTTFSSTDNMKWRVLNINKENGQIELISADGTPANLSMGTTTGFNNSIDILNDISKVYGHGDGAVDARSITKEDIEKYATLNEPKYMNTNSISYGSVKKYTSGSYYKEIVDDNNNLIRYEKTKTTATSSAPISIRMNYYIYDNLNRYVEYKSNSKIADMLTKNSSNSNRNYWVASQSANTFSSYVNFGIFYVTSNRISVMGESDKTTYKVCPVVILEPNITLEMNENGEWDIKQYEISYDLNGGESRTDLPSLYTGGKDIVLPYPKKEGYSFAGWTGTDLIEVTKDVIIPAGSTGNRTYTAHWKETTNYTIEYDLDGGIFKKNNPTEYTDASEDIKLLNPKKEGYSFAGWTGTGLTEQTKEVIIPYGSTGNRTYTAHWKEMDFNIYATLYTDGTLVFTNDGRVVGDRSSSEILLNSDITGVNFTSSSSMPWNSNKSSIKYIDFIDDVIPSSTQYWFYYLNQLERIDHIENLDMQNCTTMNNMFNYCSSLTELDLSSFDTGNVTNMSNAFSNCSLLQNVNLKGFNTSKVTAMDNMFAECKALEQVDLSTFDTSGVTASNGLFRMFANCKALKEVDLSSFKNTNIINMGSMFSGCTLLEKVDLTNFVTSAVKNMANMFYGCSSLTKIDLSSFNTSAVTTMAYMFYGCSSLTELNLSSFDTSAVTTMTYMFTNCSSLTELDLRNFDTNKVTTMANMFQNCSNLTAVIVGQNWKTASTTTNMFSNCGTKCVKYEAEPIYAKLYDGNTLILTATDREIDEKILTKTYGNIGGDLYTRGADVPWYNEYLSINSIIVEDEISPILTDYWFYGLTNLTSIDLNKLNTSNVTSMKYMFYNCSKLTSLDLSHFVTNNVKDMNSMFYGCSGLTSLNISQFNTSKVTSMYYMFYNCKLLTSLNIRSFNTESVINMCGMFNLCSGLETLNLTHFNTVNVTNMSSMFYGCSGLTTLDLTSFDTKNVTTMSAMFRNCSAMTEITVSSNWVTASTNTNMFTSCGVSSVTVV